MGRLLARFIKGLALLLTFAVVVFSGFLLAGRAGWLTLVGIQSETTDSQVIQAVERTQEVSLVSLSVQGIVDRTDRAEVFGQGVPGTEEKVFLQYNFDAKLGIDGAAVQVTKTGDHTYEVVVPDYTFVGYDEPTFRVATEDGGILSWATPDIDKVEMVNEVLDDDARQDYITENRQVLEEQTQFFYDSLVTSIDAEAEISYEFQS